MKDIKRWLPGLIISLIFIVFLAKAVDWSSVLIAFQTIDLRFLVFHGIFYFLALFARALASRALLEDRPTPRDAFVVMMQGYLLNNVLPLRLGELGRAYLLGRKTGLGTFHALPAIVIERFYDLAFAAILLIGTLPFVLHGAAWARPVALTTLSIVTLGLLSLHFVARFRLSIRNWIDRLAARVVLIEKYILPQIDSFLDGLAVLMNRRAFILSLVFIALSWALGAASQFSLLRGFMPNAIPLYSTFALGAASFAGAIPSAPSGLGIYEGAIVGALAIVGISSGLALAFAVLHHIMHIIYSSVIGFYGFSKDGIGVMKLYEQLKNREEESTKPH